MKEIDDVSQQKLGEIIMLRNVIVKFYDAMAMLS